MQYHSICIISTNACANFLRKSTTSSRDGARFGGEIAQWLKIATVYQSYVDDHAVKQAHDSMSPSIILFFQYGLLLIIIFGNGEYISYKCCIFDRYLYIFVNICCKFILKQFLYSASFYNCFS